MGWVTALRSRRPPALEGSSPFGGGYFPGIERGVLLNVVIAFGHWLFVTEKDGYLCGWVPVWTVDWELALRVDDLRVSLADDESDSVVYWNMMLPLSDSTASEIFRRFKAKSATETELWSSG